MENPPKKLNKVPAILVMRNLGGIGDMLMLTCTIKALKEQNPDTPLIVTTTRDYGLNNTLFDLLKYNPYIDKVIPVEELKDYTFKKTYNFNTGIECKIEADPRHPTSGNRIDIFSDLAEVELKDKVPIYVMSPEEKVWAKNWVKKTVPSERRKIIGIQVQTSSPRRDWPEEKSLLLALTLTILYKDISVLLFYDTTKEFQIRNYPNVYSVVGLRIRKSAALLNECEVMVVPDSALLHMAGVLGKKAVALFGSTPPEARVLYYPTILAIQEKGCCSCWYSECYNHYECMRNIIVDTVLQAVLNQLKGKKIPPMPKQAPSFEQSRSNYVLVRK